MSQAKARRHRALSDLIRNGSLASQEGLVEQLGRLGFTVTQATVSRDLEQLGAIKVRRNGAVAYTLPAEAYADARSVPRLAAIVREWVRSMDVAGNLIVLRTPPGSAHLVGVALDQAELADVVGTICGDDTIFVAVRDADKAQGVAADLRRELG